MQYLQSAAFATHTFLSQVVVFDGRDDTFATFWHPRAGRGCSKARCKKTLKTSPLSRETLASEKNVARPNAAKVPCLSAKVQVFVLVFVHFFGAPNVAKTLSLSIKLRCRSGYFSKDMKNVKRKNVS